MIKKIKERREKKIKTFLFFLLLATVFWVLTKYSNEYTQSIISKVTYTNLPQNTVLSEDNISEISFDVVANGFEFLVFKIKKPTVNIDVSRYYSKNNKAVTISNNELKKLITTQLNKNILVRNVSVNELPVHLTAIKTKKIVITPTFTINYKAGYKNTQPPLLSPDSVMVSAPEKVLDSLHSIKTESVTFSEVTKSIDKKIKLSLPENEFLNISPTEVRLTIPVEETVQKTVELPVTLLNLPRRLTVKIIPETVSVTYTTSVSKFNKINPDEFTIVADYVKRNENETSLPVRVSKQPEQVFDVLINPQVINFLIVKQ